MIGTTIANYEILAQLGSGGMGVVYKARDTRLDRLVALKFLPPDLSRDEEANERFIHEAKAASALHHPNICAIHDVKETEDGRFYIVMPLYEGQTLKYRLEEGPIDPGHAVEIVRQIASGLGAAHAKGIVHRDIKPANIMITDTSQVIILDFGVAKLSGRVDLTKTGSTVGTAFYMPPEQIRGEKVDERADLWALGVVFYQMLTGKRPFEGEYEQAVSYSILNYDPPLDTSVVGTHGPVLKRLLAKDRNDRFANARELEDALESAQKEDADNPAPHTKKAVGWARGRYAVAAAILVGASVFAILNWSDFTSSAGTQTLTTTPTRHTIAVLPFINLRSDPEIDFLGYAMADQVIGSLSYVKNINVRPASSVRAYQDRQYDARQAGKDLAVDYVVTGSYLRQAGRVRLAVEMVDVHRNEIVWTEPVEVSGEDVFEMQDIVAGKVLDRLAVSFSQDERSRMRSDVPGDPLAYEYYLRAVSQPRTIEGNQLAMDLLEQSITLDSTYAPAWSDLGWRRHALGLFGMAGAEMSRTAAAAFERALEINPELISALADISTYYNDSGRTDEAYELAVRAIKINPNNALGHFAKGYALRYAGLLDLSEKEMRTTLDLDSTNTRYRSAGITFTLTGHFEDARRAFAIDAPSPYYYSFTGETYYREGRIEEALPFFEKAASMNPEELPVAWGTAFLGHITGNHADGVAATSRMEAARVVDGETDYYIGFLYCANGNNQGCLRCLRNAVNNGYFNYPTISTEPLLDPVRGTQEFQEILALALQKHQQFNKRHFGS